jgi:hypothetical protein
MAATEVAAGLAAEQEADQLAFFGSMAEGFRRAVARAGMVEKNYQIGGFSILLRFAGPALIPVITPALAHLEEEPDGKPDFIIEFFDSNSTQSRLPFLADRFVDLIRMQWWDHLDNRREIKGMNGSRIRSVYHLGPGIISTLDTERDHAVYWVDDALSVPYYEKGYPVSVLLNWWLAEKGRYFVHAASIGFGQNGVLLTGKGGSGKSTTTLACVMSGLVVSGDDYAVVDPLEARAYSLYNTIKLKSLGDVRRFPGLIDCVSNLAQVEESEKGDGEARETEGGEKAMIFLHQHYPASLTACMQLKGILVPRIVDRKATEIVEASTAIAFKALAPSTVFQLPGNAHKAFRGLAQMVRRIPAYEITLGSDRQRIASAIRDFIGNA